MVILPSHFSILPGYHCTEVCIKRDESKNIFVWLMVDNWSQLIGSYLPLKISSTDEGSMFLRCHKTFVNIKPQVTLGTVQGPLKRETVGPRR